MPCYEHTPKDKDQEVKHNSTEPSSTKSRHQSVILHPAKEINQTYAEKSQQGMTWQIVKKN